MIVVEYDRVEVDYCVVCSGVWLDAGEIELLFGDHRVWDALLAGGGPANMKEASRRCPACRKTMEKRVAGAEKPVMYDQCVRGDGLWFDQGELETLLRHDPGLAGSETIKSFLSEVFTGRRRNGDGG